MYHDELSTHVEDGIGASAGVGSAVGLRVGIKVGAGVYDTLKVMTSAIEVLSEHASVMVYSLTAASPETVLVCWPSLSAVDVWMTVPSRSVTLTSRVVQVPGLPRYTQMTSHSTSETHVDAVPTLVICRNDSVGTIVGTGAAGSVGVAVGAAEGAALGSLEGMALEGEGVGAGVNDTAKFIESAIEASSSHVSAST